MNTTRRVGIALLILLPIMLPACGRADGDEKPKFPADWIGVWEGDLRITAASGKTRTVKSRLTVAATDAKDRWRWEIKYGEQPARKYELVTADIAKGKFEIDEKNSTVIPAQLLGDELISVFSVAPSRITIRYRKVSEGIVLDVLSTTTEPTVTTGGEGEDLKVLGFGVYSLQRGLLKPVKAK